MDDKEKAQYFGNVVNLLRILRMSDNVIESLPLEGLLDDEADLLRLIVENNSMALMLTIKLKKLLNERR